MKKMTPSRAQKEILNTLSNLNVFEAVSVLDFVYLAVKSRKADLAPSPMLSKSKIELDRELFEFILGMDLEFMTQKDVLTACIDKFGKERAPSRTGLNRLWREILAKKAEANKSC